MTSHEWAKQMHEVADLLEKAPVFDIPRYMDRASVLFSFFSDKPKFLAAAKAVRVFVKEFGDSEVRLTTRLESGAEIQLLADRNTVCRLVSPAKYECEPLLTPEESNAL